jgi:hypothetical protein
MVATRMVILTIFVMATMCSIMVIYTLVSIATSTRLFDFFSLKYWCWHSYRCWMITLMAVLTLWLKLEIWGNLSWYLQVYNLIFMSLFCVCLSEKYKIS